MTPEIQIDPEFESLLMPLAGEEREQLEENLKATGCRDPLSVWNGTNPPTLIDGHNRYAICQANNIAFSVLAVELESREAVVDWMVRNQLGRRNVTAEQASYLRGKRYNAEKGNRGGDRRSNHHCDGLIVADRLASDFKVGKATIERDGAFAAAVDAVTELGGSEARDAVLSRKVKLDRKSVKKIAKIAETDKGKAKEILNKVMDGEAKNVKLAEQAVDAEEDCRRMELMGEDSFVPDVRHCSMCDLLDSLSGVDAIVTDPPYPQEFLPLYGDLARLAAKALKPDGILAVMCGETWLPEIMALMSPHIPYRWTMAYLTPGGQAVQVWPRKVNTFWKPILLFGGSPEWIGDVVQSSVNDNDKRFHEWGQSQSGMMDLLDRLTRVGDLVCDPFLGAGTTGVAAVAMSRRFIGCDINRDHVKTASDRIRLAVKMSEGP